MKKILLIGNFNKVFQSLNDCLKKDFSIQLCGNSKEQVRDMVKIVRPDMAILSLVGVKELDVQIFEYFHQAVWKMPLLVIGTTEECSQYERYREEENFAFMERPLKTKDLIARCFSLLQCDNGQTDTEEKETVSVERKSVLVVDDSPIMVRKIKNMLDEKYAVRVATSGKMALNALQKKKVDVIVLDYEMPEMDGMLTMEAIKENDELKEIPIIFLTGVSDKQHILAVLKLKPFKYLLKPPVEKDLLDAIEAAVSEDK